MNSEQTKQTNCCVVGGGPAGMMLGFLLARAGVQVTVLEKHRDFFRDFRGDTVHPSTLQLFHELDILDQFLRTPHQEIRSANAVYGDYAFTVADFRHLRAHCGFIALVPQWDFLNFLASQASSFPNFRLQMEHEVTSLRSSDGRISGVEVKTPTGTELIDASLVVACDGRHSILRGQSDLPLVDSGVPIDVLWFRVSRSTSDPEQVLGHLNYGKGLILINRGDYFQAGLLIRKGAFDQVQQAGMEKFRRDICEIAPFLAGRTDALENWDQIKLLTVQINLLRRWHRPGLLCLGDAAGAMSPVGGVGINLAIQDAVAAARILTEALLLGRNVDGLLPKIQQRREPPRRMTQFFQKRAHQLLTRSFGNSGPQKAPWQLRTVVHIPGFTRLMGRVVGQGFRPEHINDKRESSRWIKVMCAVGSALAIVCWKHRTKGVKLSRA